MLFKLFTAPVHLVKKVGEKVQEEADKELYDLNTIQRKLVQLQTMYELDEISGEVYEQQETELMERYEIAKRREMEQWEELTKQKDEEEK
ncbi:gas vesicle protein GvpG [Virgibacillus halophilus]|uniref:Gas vesicle protein GvpG n=1 Tax=Tigheibacillus halophilus TaxID=361280 RepID=A0ABU5C5J9_9BACI|nr:gas vesicle protein GvpG [Virgibacillus halophilus]